MKNAAIDRAQATSPVQPDRTPQSAEQVREQDSKDAEDVRIGRDWKAQGSDASPISPRQISWVKIIKRWVATGARALTAMSIDDAVMASMARLR
jgi:hypothetical protein